MVQPVPSMIPLTSTSGTKCCCTDCIRWQAEHDGRINAWWYTQHAWNRDVEDKIDNLAKRMTAQEKRQMWLSGASAAFGAMSGVLLGWILQRLFGG